MRWWFAIKNGWKERAQLKQFLVTRAKQIHSLNEITAAKLDDAHIAILVLDFDGVLAAHDALQPLPEAEQWLRQLSLQIGEQRIAILTNKPKAARLRYFTEHFPSILILPSKKKPYPDGLLAIANYRGVPPHRVLLVDDRLLTGMLATCLAFTQGWYFYPPRRNIWRHPFKELFFSCLRVIERGFFRVMG